MLSNFEPFDQHLRNDASGGAMKSSGDDADLIKRILSDCVTLCVPEPESAPFGMWGCGIVCDSAGVACVPS
jgi:hypothetical protein